MDTTKLIELIEIAKSSGVSYLKFGEVEVSFFELAKPSIPVTDLTPKTQELSNEDMLFYSVEAPIESKE